MRPAYSAGTSAGTAPGGRYIQATSGPQASKNGSNAVPASAALTTASPRLWGVAASNELSGTGA